MEVARTPLSNYIATTGHIVQLVKQRGKVFHIANEYDMWHILVNMVQGSPLINPT